MAVYKVESHAVEATRVTQVQPLRRADGQLIHPDDGLLLTLSDNTHRKWLIEGEVTPHVGDWLIVDLTMHVSYVVNPTKFAELFTVAE